MGQVHPADEEHVAAVAEEEEEDDPDGPGVFDRLEKLVQAPKRRPSQRPSYIDRNSVVVSS